MKNIKYKLMLLAGIQVAVAIACICGMWAKISSGDEMIIWGCAALIFALFAFVTTCFSLIADMAITQKSFAGVLEYVELKRRTIKIMRELQKDGELTTKEIQRQKTVFLLKAEEIGILQNVAEEEFEIEIRNKVKR